MTKPTSLSLPMLTIGAPFTAVIATSQATRTQYHLGGLISAAATDPVASLQRGGALILFWIQISPLPRHTRFQTVLPIRNTFRVPALAITTLLTIRTFTHSI